MPYAPKWGQQVKERAGWRKGGERGVWFLFKIMSFEIA
jgi:hypothetical protein